MCECQGNPSTRVALPACKQGVCSDLRSSRRSDHEPQQLRIIAHLTSDQLKNCSCARIRISGNSLVFPAFTLVSPILLQAAAGGVRPTIAVHCGC